VDKKGAKAQGKSAKTQEKNSRKQKNQEITLMIIQM
jgi:hypothetical protein